MKPKGEVGVWGGEKWQEPPSRKVEWSIESISRIRLNPRFHHDNQSSLLRVFQTIAVLIQHRSHPSASSSPPSDSLLVTAPTTLPLPASSNKASSQLSGFRVQILPSLRTFRPRTSPLSPTNPGGPRTLRIQRLAASQHRRLSVVNDRKNIFANFTGKTPPIEVQRSILDQP